MNYTSGNNAPTQMAQMPNRVGNKSKTTPSHTGGVTAQTNPKQGGIAYAPGCQKPPAANGSITGRHQPVALSKPKGYDGACHNDGYMDKSIKNYLK